MKHNYRTEVVTAGEDIAALEPGWTALAVKSRSVLGSFEWLDACRQWLNADKRAIIFVTRDENGVRALAPLMITGTGPRRRLVALSHGSGEPAVFLHDDSAALRQLSEAIIHFGMPLALTRFHVDAPELTALRESSIGHGKTVYRKSSGQGFGSSRVILANLKWETLVSRMSSSSRTYLRRKRGIAQREGTVSFEALSPTQRTVDGLVDEVLAVEGSGWKGRAGTSLASDHAQLRFYREYARSTAKSGTLRIFFLKVGGAIAAVRMDVEFGNRLWEFKIGYDERFARASPGIVLMHETLAWACAEGLDAYEFLGNFETWHTHWPFEPYSFATLYYYPRRISGVAALAHDTYQYARRWLSENRNRDTDIASSTDAATPADTD